MSELHTSIPITVFDQTFARADKEEHNRNHNSSSSKNKTNKGLNAPSEYRLTFGEWSENMSLFRRYLALYYDQKPLAKRLRLHIENVKAIKLSHTIIRAIPHHPSMTLTTFQVNLLGAPQNAG